MGRDRARYYPEIIRRTFGIFSSALLRQEISISARIEDADVFALNVGLPVNG